jgi:hypothetical protein
MANARRIGGAIRVRAPNLPQSEISLTATPQVDRLVVPTLDHKRAATRNHATTLPTKSAAVANPKFQIAFCMFITVSPIS